LLYAVSSKKTEIVSVLLGRGANPNRPNKAGLTATFQAFVKNKRDIIELIEAFEERNADYGD
jgi:ankyrin repeat protein